VSDALVYLDSSAILKLILEEPETAALVEFLKEWPSRVSSMLARVEVSRIIARVNDPAIEREARTVLGGINLVRMDDGIVAAAAALGPPSLRSLDAIHLATAQVFGHHLAGFVVYDRRLAAAARHHGLTVWSPA
jgi:uncharacterized protein